MLMIREVPTQIEGGLGFLRPDASRITKVLEPQVQGFIDQGALRGGWLVQWNGSVLEVSCARF